MNAETLQGRIAAIEAGFSGEVAVAAKNLATGEAVAYREDEVYATASLIKLPILVELWRQSREGKVDLTERRELADDQRVGGTGILKVLDAGLRPTVRDLGVLMTVLSDNVATNLLIELLGGTDPVNRYMRDLGFDSIALRGRVDFEAIARDSRNLGEASCADMMRLMEALVSGEILDRPACDEVLDVLRGQQLLDQVPRYLAYNPWAAELHVEQELDIANKTGVLLGMRSDVGAMWLSESTPVVYCVTAQHADDVSVGPENEAIVTVGLVGRALVEHWWPGDEVPTLPTAYADSEADAARRTPASERHA